MQRAYLRIFSYTLKLQWTAVTTLSLLSATFLLEQLLPGAGGGVNGYFLHSDSKFAIPHFAMVNGGAMSWPRRCAAAY